jgi:hypothetical protein
MRRYSEPTCVPVAPQFGHRQRSILDQIGDAELGGEKIQIGRRGTVPDAASSARPPARVSRPRLWASSKPGGARWRKKW